MPEMVSQNSQTLSEMLKVHTQEFDALKDAFKEVAEEQADEKKKQAKELIKEGLGLIKQLRDKKNEFESSFKKVDKTLGKIMKRIQALANGRSVEEVDKEEKEEESNKD